MYKSLSQNTLTVASLLAFAIVPSLSHPASATQFYEQTNLVSDIPGLAAVTDSNLVNPWGISFSTTGPFWISDNGTGVSTLYNSVGQPLPLVVTIPGAGNVTGQVFNGGTGFNSDRFLFASEDGTISGWRNALGNTAETLVPGNSTSVYKGLAIGNNGSGDFLYAANFKAGTIDVFNQNSNPVSLSGSFSDPTIPAAFAPFNIQNLGGQLYVTYALQDGFQKDDVAGPGNGFVNVFNTDGQFVKRLASNGTLNSPWGLAIAPGNFGAFSNALLVGNFGDGKINAFNPTTDTFLGQLQDATSNPLTIDGLWGLAFGNGGSAGKPNELFFTAGINGEANGLFGKLQSQTVPEPTSPLSLIALGTLGAASTLKCKLKSSKTSEKEVEKVG